MGFIFLTILSLGAQSYAYLSVNETAELLPEGYFRFGIAPQLKLSDDAYISGDAGLNVGAYFDFFIVDDLNGRFELGGGKTDFWAQASAKWVPFPDVDRQPAMGVRGAFIYARNQYNDNVNGYNATIDSDFYDFQIAPIISKLADTRYGKMIPFVSLPITLVNRKDKSYTATQFAVGAEWFSHEKYHIGAEFDLNLSNSFSAISTFISFPFDSSIGYKR